MIVQVIDLDAGGSDPGRQLADLDENKAYYIFRNNYWVVIFDQPMTVEDAIKALDARLSEGE